MDYRFNIALIYDFDGTLAPGNMQEYDFIPAVGKSNKEFWTEANTLAEEQDADMVIMLHRPEMYTQNPTDEERGLAAFHIPKHRNGETGKIDALFQGHYSRFTNAPV